jgi:signal peptidase I
MRRKYLIVISAIAVAVIIVGSVYYFFQIRQLKNVTIRGNSLTPYLANGDEVLVDYSYQNSNRQLERDSLIVYNFKPQNKQLIKFVKVVPGDTFQVDEQNRVLLINNQPMTNSQNLIYRLTRQNIKMLKLYEDYFNGVLKGNVYLSFGNWPGTLDSGKFGPITRKNIIGKVLFKL